jgi:hypothetical protein
MDIGGKSAKNAKAKVSEVRSLVFDELNGTEVTRIPILPGCRTLTVCAGDVMKHMERLGTDSLMITLPNGELLGEVPWLITESFEVDVDTTDDVVCIAYTVELSECLFLANDFEDCDKFEFLRAYKSDHVIAPANMTLNGDVIPQGRYFKPLHDDVHTYLERGLMPTRLLGKGNRNRRKGFKRRSEQNYKICEVSGQIRLFHTRSVTRKKVSTDYKSKMTKYPFQMVLYNEELIPLIREAHDQCHDGVDRSELHFNRKFWTGKSVREHIQECHDNCDLCQTWKASMTNIPCRTIISRRPNERFIMDLTHLPDECGGGWLILCEDHFTKHLWSKLLKGKQSPPIVKFLTILFNQIGWPAILQCDNGNEFRDILPSVLAAHDTDERHGQPYNPRCQGLVENKNKTVKRKIIQRVTQAQRDSGEVVTDKTIKAHLRIVTVNENQKKVKMYGFSPHELYWGQTHEGEDYTADELLDMYGHCVEKMQSQGDKNELKQARKMKFNITVGMHVRVKLAWRKDPIRRSSVDWMDGPWKQQAIVEERHPQSATLFRVRWTNDGGPLRRAGALSNNWFRIWHLLEDKTVEGYAIDSDYEEDNGNGGGGISDVDDVDEGDGIEDDSGDEEAAAPVGLRDRHNGNLVGYKIKMHSWYWGNEWAKQQFGSGWRQKMFYGEVMEWCEDQKRYKCIFDNEDGSEEVSMMTENNVRSNLYDDREVAELSEDSEDESAKLKKKKADGAARRRRLSKLTAAKKGTKEKFRRKKKSQDLREVAEPDEPTLVSCSTLPSAMSDSSCSSQAFAHEVIMRPRAHKIPFCSLLVFLCVVEGCSRSMLYVLCCVYV